MKSPIAYKSSNEKEKYLAKSSFSHKFKGFFKFRVSDIRGEEEEEPGLFGKIKRIFGIGR